MPDGDHSFTRRKAAGRTEEQNRQGALEEIVGFVLSLPAGRGGGGLTRGSPRPWPNFDLCPSDLAYAQVRTIPSAPWNTGGGWNDRLGTASACQTNGTSLIPFRAVVPQFGRGSWLHQAVASLRPPLPRPALPPPRAAADPVVRHRPDQRIDQRRPVLRPRGLDLRGERGHRLLGPLEAHLP